MTTISFEIKLACELERVWIMLDLNSESNLEFEQVLDAFEKMGLRFVKLSQEQIKEAFDSFDKDKNGAMDQAEMAEFVTFLLKIDEIMLKQMQQWSQLNREIIQGKRKKKAKNIWGSMINKTE